MSLFRVQEGFSIEGIISAIKSHGSPEGVKTARPGSYCSDEVNGIIYAKMTGLGNTGWVPLNGPESNFRGDVVGADTGNPIEVLRVPNAVDNNLSIFIIEICTTDDDDSLSMHECTYKLVVSDREIQELQHGILKFGTTITTVQYYAEIDGTDIVFYANVGGSATTVTIDYFYSLLKRI
jgi:hypothetical protein